MLFGNEISFDHPDYYNTCARIKTYDELMYPNYEKENTKPLFLENELLTVHNLYNYHIIINIFNILKYRTPYSLFDKFSFSARKELSLVRPTTLHSKRLQNFICKSTAKWNEVSKIIFEHTTLITIRGLLILIPGSAVGSDLTAKTSTIKLKLKNILLSIQSQ